MTGAKATVSDAARLQRAVFDARPLFRKTLDRLLGEELPTSMPLRRFRERRIELPLENRLTLVDQALLLMRDFYVNRPIKEALQAASPVRRLELLRLELEGFRREGRRSRDLPPALDFHREMTEIFTSVHDRHARYLLPEPFAGRWALLGFDVEIFYDPRPTRTVLGAEVIDEVRIAPADAFPTDRLVDEAHLSIRRAADLREPRYLVTRLTDGLEKAIRRACGPEEACRFRRGVEIVSWNGVSIDRAVELNGDRHAGANRAARHARGVTRLTVRPLRTSPLPDEDWVVIGYRERNEESETRYVMLEWRVVSLARSRAARSEAPPARIVATVRIDGDAPDRERVVDEIRLDSRALRIALDESRDEEAVEVARLYRALLIDDRSDIRRLTPAGDESRMPKVMRAVAVPTGADEWVGYIRIYTFDDPEHSQGSGRFVDEFVDEFVRLLRMFREIYRAWGLILDVRDNGGGRIRAGERILQTLTSRRIEPERFEFLSNPTTLAFCRESGFPARWGKALDLSARLGAQYSRGFPISSPRRCNDIGQVFFGPVALIVNALSYSTTDIFAAGFQDHAIGPIVATDDNIGAGGANTASHAQLRRLWGERGPLEKLPGRAGMKVAIRRSLRVGERVGTPLEEVGIKWDHRYHMTANDLLSYNYDLIHKTVKILRSQPRVRVEKWQSAIDGINVWPRVDRVSRIRLRLEDRGLSRGLPAPGPVRLENPTAVHLEGLDARGRLVANERREFRTRLEPRVDWFVDFCTFLSAHASRRAPGPEPYRGALDELRALDSDRRQTFLDLATGASHTRSLRRLFSLKGHRADKLLDVLEQTETTFRVGAWPAHRRQIRAATVWLRKRFIPRERDAIIELTRSLGVQDTGITVPVYLVGEAPFAGRARSRGDATFAPYITSVAGSRANLARSLLGAAYFLLVHGTHGHPPQPGPLLTTLRTRARGRTMDLENRLALALLAHTVLRVYGLEPDWRHLDRRVFDIWSLYQGRRIREQEAVARLLGSA